ncbi:MAG: isochorismatase, partial [Myxococcaceae bacterium]|nr:isochorismatase [Myxococcaceae bacterium]
MPFARAQRPHASPDLHGNAPDKCGVALLLIDVINDLQFPGADRLLQSARPAALELAALKERAARAGVPCIYANDNFGRWRSDFNTQVQHVRDGTRGASLAELLAPSERDYFVLKARHSAFYQTCLELLLEHLGVKAVIVGGFTTDSCIHFTASDAYLRGLGLTILRDGCAAQTSTQH